MGCTTSIEGNDHKFIRDRFKTYEELTKALQEAGVEACELIVGIDFTKSNTWQGGPPFYESANLHSAYPFPNPYQRVLSIMCKSLQGLDNDNLIPAFGFGDSRTTNKEVFPFLIDEYNREMPCVKLDGVLRCYNDIVNDIQLNKIQMSGPTSFAPIINKAIQIVQETNSYHILIIICDGAVTNEQETIQAIVKASSYPLSIICVGVGKGPWGMMEKFDDNIRGRIFDNFQFVDFHKMMAKCENQEVEFAHQTLMEIPDQYAYIKKYIFKY